MISRRLGIVGLSSMSLLLMLSNAWAQALHVMESTPAASAVIDGRSTEFFVRFDRPVDHVHSLLSVVLGGKVVETLHPRLESAPEVLFARTSTLPPGDYKLHWSVRTMTGADVIQGDIPFTVKQ